MAAEVQWGVLGNATIARKCVIGAIGKSRNGSLRALASRSPDTARGVVTRHGIPRLYGSYQALLDDPAISAVYIPLPNHLHRPWTEKALAAGKHVLCEKPLGCDAWEVESMTAAAKKADRLLMEAFMYRFHPRSRRIKLMVEQGQIGAARLVRAAFCYHMAADVLQSGVNSRLQPEMGGGALLDVGCYAVSVARWLMNAEPMRVQAQATFHPSGVDWHLVGSLYFGPRRLAVVEASFIAALQQTYSVVGDRGAIDLPHDAFIPWEKEAEFVLRGRDDETGTRQQIAGADQYQLMVEHFADAVLGRSPLAFLPEESVANMRVLDALSRAARSGRCEMV
ncbi:Gfo/Idh/MocA family protein [Desulfosarcina sp.]|uniref:Gfo/Idh/MocA family protein n=1 Tax=Desulfosarcina sp. TaxID=2027861 RepID=UPI0035662332